MKCPYCGAEIDDFARKCDFCGSAITAAALKENERVRKKGCPNCASTNISFRRENHGEVRNTNSTQNIFKTIGVCQDCGYTFIPETQVPNSIHTSSKDYTSNKTTKPNNTVWWVLGWIFFFPAPAMVLIWRKKNTWDVKVKIAVTIVFWIVLFAISGSSDSSSSSSSSSKSTSTTQPTPALEITKEEADKETAELKAQIEQQIEVQEEVVVEEPKTEINPDIPLGTKYTLGQGMYEIGTDIPAGRYMLTYVDGNQFGGYIKGSGEYLNNNSMDPEVPICVILNEGDTFEIDLITIDFEKISSLQNNYFLQDDGSYLLGEGYYFEGIDFPCGKYDITAVKGNQFGMTLKAKEKRISLDMNETFSNFNFSNEGAVVDISLGSVKLDPK